MRPKTEFTPLARSARLWRRSGDDPPSYWTQALGTPPSVYGERTVEVPSGTLRRWDPNRSKLSAALSKGWTEPLPQPEERWLYLGAASGTTASHIADLVDVDGVVYAVEKSLRPFSRLLRLSEGYPNLAPILSDARDWPSVPSRSSLRSMDSTSTSPSLTRSRSPSTSPDGSSRRPGFSSSRSRPPRWAGRRPRAHLDRAVQTIEHGFAVEETVPLDPFHRKHYLIAARPTRRMVREAGPEPSRPVRRPESRAGRRP